MNVLLDTPVWIRYFANEGPLAERVDALADAERLLAHELVHGELLIGHRGGRTRFLSTYDELPFAPVVAHAEVVELVRTRKLHGRGIGWIDAHLLASALIAPAVLWTVDARVAAVADELGVGFARR